MSLTIQDFQRGRLIIQTPFVSSLYINHKSLYQFGPNEYYERLDSHSIPISDGRAGLYEVNGRLYVLFHSNFANTLVRKMRTIEGKTVDEFTGFEYGKIYELTNGQKWQQTDSLHAPGHHSSGNVVIFDDSILKVDNWSFYPTVTLLPY